MPTVRFPAVMKYYVNNQAEFSVMAPNVKDLIDQVVEQYPSVKFHLLDSEGQLRRHFNIFINGIHIRDLNGMETPLKEEDKVILMASAAGGLLYPVFGRALNRSNLQLNGSTPLFRINRSIGDCFVAEFILSLSKYTPLQHRRKQAGH